MATYFELGILKSFFSIQSDLAVPLIGPYREVEFFHSNLSPISCTENLSSFLPLLFNHSFHPLFDIGRNLQIEV